MKIFLMIFFVVLFLGKAVSYSQYYSKGSENHPDSLNIVQFDPLKEYHSGIVIPQSQVKDTSNSILINYSNKNFLRENFLNLASVGVLTGFLMISDEPGWKLTRKIHDRSNFFKSSLDYAVYVGDGKFSLALAGLFASYGFLGNDKRAKYVALDITKSLLISGIMVQALKRITGRESPAASSTEGGAWRPLPRLHDYNKHQAKYYAFPSGHITTITSTLTIICNNYPEQKWLRPFSYGVIGMVGIGLVAKDMHWYSDLPLGIFLGYTIANIISPEKEMTSNFTEERQKEYFHLAPYYNFFHSGVQISLSF